MDFISKVAMGASAEASLCTQLTAAASGMAVLTKGLRLSKLIEKAIEVVRRILEEFLSFISCPFCRQPKTAMIQ